jgi:DnaJ-domain-containing protein 1
MSSNVQYAALARLLDHNNRVHDLREILSRMQVTIGETDQAELPEELQINPLADLQNEIDREVRASLVSCWLAIPEVYED